MIRISVRAVKAGEHDRGKFRVAEDAATVEFEVSARLQERIADELGVLKVKKGGALRALLRAEAGKGTRRTRRKPV